MVHFFGGGTAGFISGVISLAVYLLQSYAIYKVSVVRSLPNPIFAFIPFFQLFMLGQIGDSLRYKKPTIDNLLGSIPLAYALPLLSIITAILAYPFSLLGSLLTSLGTIIVYYLLFSFYTPKQAILFTAISSLSLIMVILSILSSLPLIGGVFVVIASVLSILTALTPVVGPLLILYAVKDYKKYY
ncbi:MAG: hypothetical protein RR205_01495 [Oscillospiraceae bacterium]